MIRCLAASTATTIEADQEVISMLKEAESMDVELPPLSHLMSATREPEVMREHLRVPNPKCMAAKDIMVAVAVATAVVMEVTVVTAEAEEEVVMTDTTEADSETVEVNAIAEATEVDMVDLTLPLKSQMLLKARPQIFFQIISALLQLVFREISTFITSITGPLTKVSKLELMLSDSSTQSLSRFSVSLCHMQPNFTLPLRLSKS